MKKSLLLSFFILIVICAKSQQQQLLFPYRIGDKYGMSDSTGKLFLQPEYTHMEWVKDGYFEASKKIILNDTLETSPRNFFLRKDQLTQVRTVIYKGKAIIKDEPFDDFRIFPGKCIVAKCDSRYYKFTKEHYAKYKGETKFCSLFSLDGKNVYPENFKWIRVGDTVKVTDKSKKQTLYLLLLVGNMLKQESLLLYDCNKQKITNWLVKDVNRIDDIVVEKMQKVIMLRTEDYLGKKKDIVIDFHTGNFVTMPEKKATPDDTQRITDETATMDVIEEMSTVAVPDMMDVQKGNPTKIKPYFHWQKDSLWYYDSGSIATKIEPLPGSVLIRMGEKVITQWIPVIYKLENKFGLIINGSYQKTAYDSLVYLGSGYLAGFKKDNRFQYGVLDENGRITVPAVYDSINGAMFSYETPEGGRNNDKMILVEKRERYSYSKQPRSPYQKPFFGSLVVFKDGKCGLLSINNELIFPVEYDLIASNEFSFINPMKSEFIILKKGGKYGVTFKKWDSKGNKEIYINTTEPVFPFIPFYYYDNYYGKKGMQLFGLYDEYFKFKGYASADGTIYFKD